MWIKLIHTPPPRMDIASHDKTEKKNLHRIWQGILESLLFLLSHSESGLVLFFFFLYCPSKDLIWAKAGARLSSCDICLQSVFTCSKSSGPSQCLQKRKKKRNYPHGNCIRENYNTSWVFPKEKVAVSTPSPCGCSEQSWLQATAPATATGSLSGFYCAPSCVCVCVF